MTQVNAMLLETFGWSTRQQASRSECWKKKESLKNLTIYTPDSIAKIQLQTIWDHQVETVRFHGRSNWSYFV